MPRPTKRRRLGLSARTGPGRSMRRTFRKRVSRRAYSRTARGRVAPRYSFHRWFTAFPGGNLNVTDCTYNTSTSIIKTNVGVSSCTMGIYFTLNDIPNVSEFTTLFDQYMITGVMLQIKMVPVPDATYMPVSAGTSNYANFYPTLWYAPDHDDNANVTLAGLKEFEKVRHKVIHPNREINIMLRPTTLQQLYRSSTTTGYACNYKRSWLDIAQADIPHYGVKLAFDMEGMTTSSTFADAQFMFKVNAKYYFKCKNVR